MTPDSTSAVAYLRTSVLTANPGELRMMLLEGALKFARQGRDGLAARDFEASFNGLSQCRNILLELISTLRPEHDPELCERVRSLYTFMFNELVQASMEKDAQRADAVIDLLVYECDTWRLVLQKLASERGAPQPAPAARDERHPLSLEA